MRKHASRESIQTHAMPEKTPHSLVLRRMGNAAIIFGCTIGLSGVSAVVITGQQVMAESPDTDAAAITVGTFRHLEDAYTALTHQDKCLLTPADLSVMSDEKLPPPDITEAISDNDLQKYGEQHGLTFPAAPDMLQAYTELEQATSIEAATDVLDDFSEKSFGVDVKLAGFDKHPERLPNVLVYKDQVATFLRVLNLMPRELIKKLDLGGIQIRPFVAESNNTAVGKFSMNTHVVTIDIDYLSNPGTFIHEVLGHAAHFSACDGYPVNDTTILGQNPPDFRYTSDKSTQSNQLEIQATATGYGQTSAAEDVAELTRSYLTQADENDALSPEQIDSVVGRKTAIVMQRLNDITPGSVAYFKAARRTLSRIDSY